MKPLFKSKEKIAKICVATLISGIILSGKVFATDIELEVSSQFEEWNKLNLNTEEKSSLFRPNSYSREIPESILSKYQYEDNYNLVGSLTKCSNQSLRNVSAASDSKFSLADELNMRIDNQGTTNECWAVSILKSMETNIALKSGEKELKNFSERHMDYSTVKTFTDGINKRSLTREAGDGGLPIMGLAYLTNGQGAVLEEKMPFKDNMSKISLKELDKPIDTIVTDYVMFPEIVKKYQKDNSGNTTSVTYTDKNGENYSESEIKAIRNMIKEYIVENGAITSFTAGSKAQYYNGDTVFSSTAYNCNDTSIIRDHAIVIVGWDDNYSRDNFREGKKPSTDGAYIVLNSYGKDYFNKGYLYISYEDFFIEDELYGISSTSKVDYTNLYQYDDFGGVLKLSTQSLEPGYIGNTYERKSNKTEILKSVGVNVCDYINVEIYVNPDGTSFDSNKLKLVGKSSKELEPGYHRIDVTPIEITGSEFAIVVKQIANNSKFAFEVEACVEKTSYQNVTSENKSYISIDGKEWMNIADLNVSGVDMKSSDVCIKGFTVEKNDVDDPVKQPDTNPEDPDKKPEEQEPNPETPTDTEVFKSDTYKIEDGYIKNITHDTTKEKLLANINTNLNVNIYEKDGTEITNNTDLIKTGAKLKLSNNKEYILIIKGDTNCDGKITLTDLSKLLLHYNGNKGFELKDEAEKAGDMNLDGKVSLVDVSQLIVLYNEI